MLKKRNGGDEMDYVYEKTKVLIINGKKSTVTVRANRPSEEALKRFANKLLEMYQKIEIEKERAD